MLIQQTRTNVTKERRCLKTILQRNKNRSGLKSFNPGRGLYNERGDEQLHSTFHDINNQCPSAEVETHLSF